MTQSKLKESGRKSTFYVCTVGPWVPNFRPYCSTINLFREIPHFFIDPMLKFQSATKFLKFADWQEK